MKEFATFCFSDNDVICCYCTSGIHSNLAHFYLDKDQAFEGYFLGDLLDG